MEILRARAKSLQYSLHPAWS